MSSRVPHLRAQYKPPHVKLLFLAESPPDSDENEVRFFYNSRQELYDHMYRAVMKAVFPEFEYRRGEKEQWLRKFQQHGYYMIDATDDSLNRLRRPERRRRLRKAVPTKLLEIRSLVARKTPIILISQNVFDVFNGPLCEAGFTVIHESFLPFPAYGHQHRFIAACRACIRQHHLCR